MRKLPVLISIATVAVLALAGCSASPSDEQGAGGTACVDSGQASESVKVTGKADAEPKVTFEDPLKVEASERTVVTEGKGDAVKDGDSVELAFSLYNATTGDQIDAGGYGDQAGLTMTVAEDAGILPALVKGTACSNVGDRVVIVAPPADGFGSEGNAELKIGAEDNLLFVIDVKGKIPTRATGEDQEPTEGFPTVALADDGTPTVTMPKTDPPTELGIEVLKKGDGAAVAEGAAVTVQYVGAVWGTGKVFDQSWGAAGPTTFTTTGVVPGFAQGLVGQTVGSQVVIVIPPELGYGAEGQPAAGIEGTDTIVFVVDILATS